MILTETSSARIGSVPVTSIASTNATAHSFRVFPNKSLILTKALGGAFGVVKNGSGLLTYSAVCNYTGPTVINGGQIIIPSASTLSGVISGIGSILKSETSNLTLGGNNSYSGGTTATATGGSASTITCNSSNALGSGLVTCQNTISITTGVGIPSITLPNNFTIASATTLFMRAGAGSQNIILSGNISSGAGGTLNKSGNGILTLTGNNTYSGNTNINAGSIVVPKTNGAVTATATFTTTSLSVSFDTPPTAGMTFKFFPGNVNRTYASVTLIGAPGRTATFNSTTSTLTIA
jgi:fibronectin-binding autotransporter adhesin